MSERTAMRMANVPEVARGRLRLPLALATAVVVAEAAVLLLRPRDGVIDPAPVSARSYFSQPYLERARDFRRPQLALYAGQLLLEGALLIYLVRRPPRWLRGAFRRPLLAGGAGGGGGAAFLLAGPAVLARLLNPSKPLPAGRARTAVLELARRAGVKVGQVYEV